MSSLPENDDQPLDRSPNGTPSEETLNVSASEVPAEIVPAAADAPEEPIDLEEPEELEEGPEERRASLRRKKLLRVLLLNDLAGLEPFPGWVADRSLGGLCLTVSRHVEEGTTLKVRRPNASEKVPWVEVTVRSVRPQETTWNLGCEFVRTPTWEVLLEFG